VSPRGCSRRLQRALTDFGADHAFAAAAAKVQEHYGVSVAAARVRTVTLHHARVLAAQAPAPVRTLPAHGPAQLVAEADGTMVPLVDTSAAPPGADRRKHRQIRYQEARLVAAQAQGTVTAHYGATLHDVAETGLRWAQCAAAAGWGLDSQIHALGDGAPWIAEQARTQFGAQGRYTVDLFHVCEYLAAAAPDPTQAKPFVAPLREALRASDHPAVLATLRPRAEPPDVPDDQAPVRAALRYLENRPDQLDYARALALDLPVGSGLIESGHRHVLQARLKQPGASWTEANAHALCQLRTLRANRQWDHYWSKN
jgi:uncharacterized protein UPF0236